MKGHSTPTTLPTASSDIKLTTSIINTNLYTDISVDINFPSLNEISLLLQMTEMNYQNITDDLNISHLKELSLPLQITETNFQSKSLLTNLTGNTSTHTENYNAFFQNKFMPIAPYDNKLEYELNKKYIMDFTQICKDRKLSAELYKPGLITLVDDIAKHASLVFTFIYSVPYNTSLPKERTFHGIQHVSRVALYIPVFLNLYRRYNDTEALQLTDEDYKLLQIAALFHDAGRQDEGVDHWDKQSSILLYQYLTKTLEINKSKAKLIAEAIANKDTTTIYHQLINLGNGKFCWDEHHMPSKNIYQRALQNADCLDIFRAREVFEGEKYLDFFKDIACNNSIAFEELAHLCVEAKSLIATHGEDFHLSNSELQKKYKTENCYSQILLDIFNSISYFSHQHKIIKSLYASGKSLPATQLKHDIIHDLLRIEAKTTNELERLLWQGKILARGITSPSAIELNAKNHESNAALEFRKMLRRIGIPTRSKKSNNTTKHGNLSRSTSLLGPNTDLFTNVGYLILNPDDKKITSISAQNAFTGFGKKKNISLTPLPNAKQKLEAISRKLKMGGYPMCRSGKRHTEIIYHVTHAHAIFYVSDDDNHIIHIDHRDANTKILEAIYLQAEYKKQASNPGLRIIDTELPIVEYNFTHQTIRFAPRYTQEMIKKLWIDAAVDYLKELEQYKFEALLNRSNPIKTLKFEMLYVDSKNIKENLLDQHYKSTLIDDINAGITTSLNNEKARRNNNDVSHTTFSLFAASPLDTLATMAAETTTNMPDLKYINPLPTPVIKK